MLRRKMRMRGPSRRFEAGWPISGAMVILGAMFPEEWSAEGFYGVKMGGLFVGES